MGEDDIYDYIDPQTGETVSFNWNKPTPPTKQDIEDQFALHRQAQNPGPLKKAWDWFTSAWGPWNPESDTSKQMDQMRQNPQPIVSMTPGVPPITMPLAHDAVGMAVGSPAAAFTTAASLGAGPLEQMGAKTGSRLLHGAVRGVNAGITAENLYNTGHDISEDKWGSAIKDAGLSVLSGLGVVGPKSGPARIATEENPLAWDPNAAKIPAEGLKLPKGMNPKVSTINPTALPLQAVPGADFQDSFRNFTNGREAARVRGDFARKQFASLDSLGQDAFKLAQENPKAPELADVRATLDQTYRDLKKAGVPLKWREAYLPQMWDGKGPSSPTNPTISLKPGFAMQRIFDTYEEGINAGLTPKYDKMSDLMADYVERAHKTIESYRLFTDMQDQGLIQKVANKGQIPDGWKIIDPNLFPISRNPKTGAVVNYAAPVEKAQQLERYLSSFSPIENKAGNALVQGAAWAKESALSSGVPGTGLNAHGFNIVARSAMAPTNNPLKEAVNTAKWLVNPDGADQFFQQNQRGAVFAARSGVTGLAQHPGDYDRPVIEGLLGKARDVQSKLFEEPLFEHVMPAVKLRIFNTVYGELAGKVDPGDFKAVSQAARQAADITNNMFGGIDWRTLGESKQFQGFLRATILAPDWLRTNGRLAKEIPASLIDAFGDAKNPVSQQYRKTARNMMVGYMAANIMNYGSTGHFMFQNDPGHEFDIQIGSTQDNQGKDRNRYLRPFGTAADAVRIPLTAAMATARGGAAEGAAKIGNMTRSRMSIPLGALTDTIAGDFRGDNIFTDRWGKPKDLGQVAGTIGNRAARLLPPYVQSGVDILSDQGNPEEAFSRGVELPLGYAAPFVPPGSRSSKKKGLGHLGR